VSEQPTLMRPIYVYWCDCPSPFLEARVDEPANHRLVCHACGQDRVELVIEAPTCLCGCGEWVGQASRGWPNRGVKKGDWWRYAGPGHIWKKNEPEYRVDDETDCWIWQRAVSNTGYGLGHRDGKMGMAHRLSYEDHKGPIPEGHQVHHRCRNRLCVNPDHLEALTQVEHKAAEKIARQEEGQRHAAYEIVWPKHQRPVKCEPIRWEGTS
jgi:hypothetical protein